MGFLHFRQGVCGFFETFEGCKYGYSFPMRSNTQSLDLWFKSYEVFKILGMLSGTANVANSAQICPKLPKFA
jgi:hypothetical protein